MKKVNKVVSAAFSAAIYFAFGIGIANAAPAVTPRQMTNYVSIAVGDAVLEERVYMKDYVDDAIDKSGGITPLVTNLVYHAVSNVVEYSVVTGMVYSSATNVVSHSLSNLIDRFDGVVSSVNSFTTDVSRTMGTAVSNVNYAVGIVTNISEKNSGSLSNIVDFVMQGGSKPQVTPNDDGTYSTRVIKVVDDKPTVYYTTNYWEEITTYSMHLGMRVIKSTVPELPEFTTFAYVNLDDSLASEFGCTQVLYNVNFDSQFKFIRHRVEGVEKEPFFNTLYTTNGASPKYLVECVDTAYLGTQTIYVYTNDTSSISNVFAMFRVQPYRLSDEEFYSVCGAYQEGDGGTDEWIDSSAVGISTVRVRNVPVSVNGKPVGGAVVSSAKEKREERNAIEIILI